MGKKINLDLLGLDLMLDIDELISSTTSNELRDLLLEIDFNDSEQIEFLSGIYTKYEDIDKDCLGGGIDIHIALIANKLSNGAIFFLVHCDGGDKIIFQEKEKAIKYIHQIEEKLNNENYYYNHGDTF